MPPNEARPTAKPIKIPIPNIPVVSIFVVAASIAVIFGVGMYWKDRRDHAAAVALAQVRATCREYIREAEKFVNEGVYDSDWRYWDSAAKSCRRRLGM